MSVFIRFFNYGVDLRMFCFCLVLCFSSFFLGILVFVLGDCKFSEGRWYS